MRAQPFNESFPARHRRRGPLVRWRAALGCRSSEGMVAPISAWAVRPSAASARAVAAHAVFLPSWSRARAVRGQRSGLMFFRLHTEFKQPARRPSSMSEYLLLVSGEPRSLHLAASENRNTGARPNWQMPNARSLHTPLPSHQSVGLLPRSVGGVAFRSSPCSVWFA